MASQPPQARQIAAALEHDSRVNTHRSDIKVEVEGEQIVLIGTVPDISTKRAALDTAVRALSAERAISDRLRLTADHPRPDHELLQELGQVLLNEPVFNDYSLFTRGGHDSGCLRDRGEPQKSVTVGVHSGDVTLSGQVESLSHGRLAEVLMWWTDGCLYVDNRLQVVPPQQDSDNEITDALRLVLEKDPLVHARQLQFRTAGGVVDIRGALASQEEKQLAVHDVWCVPGVSDVIERIEIQP